MATTLQLRLIPATAVVSTANAQTGFLPGSDVAAWLEEMARHPEARFFGVPDSAQDVDAGGLLILPGPGVRQHTTQAFGPRVIPCHVENERVAVPAGTALDPRLSPEEAVRLLTYHAYFFHPTIGLVAFEETDAITAESLIVPSLPRATAWHAAMPGRGQPPPLRQVMLLLPEDDASMFGDAALDIGSKSPDDLQRKAPPMEKLKDALAGGAAAAGAGLIMGLVGLAKMLGAGTGSASRSSSAEGGGGGGKAGQGGGGNGLFDRLDRWTSRQLEKLQRQRESEIQRLLKMLESNPEQGLRHALPMTGGGDAARGQAPPGGRLGVRNPVWGSRGGSGPADVWNLSDDTRWALQQKYRTLANRELAEGRFERAAYIFAELLGDWHGAAGALVRGRKFQEAARIYITRLNNKPQAARCLEDGRLLADAVLLYAELGQHEKCGDLFRLLGREHEAVAAYKEAIKGGHNRLEDARILFDKLRQPQLALAVLASGYPSSVHARACLEKQFEYLGKMGATGDALALAAGLAEPERQIFQGTVMAEMLHAIHRNERDHEVQAQLATVALGVIGTALSKSAEGEAKFLQLLPDFAPSDRLLKRDAGRFLDNRQRARRNVKNAAPKPGLGMTCHSSIRLPQDGTQWLRLVTGGKRWLATGLHPRTRQDVWVLGSESRIIGKLTSAHGWRSSLPLEPLLLPGQDHVWLPFAREGENARYGQTRSADFSFVPESREQFISRLGWLPPCVLAVYPVAEGMWVLHGNVTSTTDLSFYTHQGSQLRTHAMGWGAPEVDVPLQVVAHEEDVFISAGSHLLHVKHGHIIHQMELPDMITHLAVSKPTQPAVVLMISGMEAVLYAPGKRGDSIQLFNSDDTAPHACFLADGRIAVGDSSSGIVYSAYPEVKKPTPIAFVAGEERFVTAYAAWGDHGVAVLRRGGVIECYA